MAFGILEQTPKIRIRNFVSFIMREVIYEYERIAYHIGKGMQNEEGIKREINYRIIRYVQQSNKNHTVYGRLDTFEQKFMVSDGFLEKDEEDEYMITLPFET